MLDKEKFNLTIKDAKDISCALDAYIKIRKLEQMNFTINVSKDNNTLTEYILIKEDNSQIEFS